MSKAKAGRKPKGPLKVSEPQRYMADEGYFFYVTWHPETVDLPYMIKCHTEHLEHVKFIADGAKKQMLAALQAIRDELNGAKWL